MATLCLIAGEKGGVGKSFVCRTLVDYCLATAIEFVIFDTDRSNPDVWKVYKDRASCRRAVLSEAERLESAANAIFNSAIEQRTLVNLPAQAMPALKTVLEEEDMFTFMAIHGISLVLWFVTDGSLESIKSLKNSLTYFEGSAQHIVVKNHGLRQDWNVFETDNELKKLLKRAGCPIVEFPKFKGNDTKEVIEARNLTLTEALSEPTFSPVFRHRVFVFRKKAHQIIADVGVLPLPEMVREGA